MYICIFPDTLCVPLAVFLILVLILAIAVVVAVMYWLQSQQNADGSLEHKPLRTTYEQEPELPLIKSGDRILYGYSGPNDECPLYFIVASVDHDNSEVYGDFRIVLPVGAKSGDSDFDRDTWVVTAEYTIGDTSVDLYYDVEHDPEELADYSVIIDSTTSGPESV